jgi:hypothetical protein
MCADVVRDIDQQKYRSQSGIRSLPTEHFIMPSSAIAAAVSNGNGNRGAIRFQTRVHI